MKRRLTGFICLVVAAAALLVAGCSLIGSKEAKQWQGMNGEVSNEK
ncbi:MAG: hypothetical protein ABH871_02545 [Pseudomonadota bacterium]